MGAGGAQGEERRTAWWARGEFGVGGSCGWCGRVQAATIIAWGPAQILEIDPKVDTRPSSRNRGRERHAAMNRRRTALEHKTASPTHLGAQVGLGARRPSTRVSPLKPHDTLTRTTSRPRVLPHIICTSHTRRQCERSLPSHTLTRRYPPSPTRGSARDPPLVGVAHRVDGGSR